LQKRKNAVNNRCEYSRSEKQNYFNAEDLVLVRYVDTSTGYMIPKIRGIAVRAGLGAPYYLEDI
jgi:hypothetical protein